MVRDRETENWLSGLPVNSPVNIDGILVWLNVQRDGAELGAQLIHPCSEIELQDALRYGFENALLFDAGFALSGDGKSLNLLQWLPGVRKWTEAFEPLEKLLNQVESLQAYRGNLRSGPSQNPMRDRIERQMRERFERDAK